MKQNDCIASGSRLLTLLHYDTFDFQWNGGTFCRAICLCFRWGFITKHCFYFSDADLAINMCVLGGDLSALCFCFK